MSSDKAMFLVFDYIVVAILAFVFAITISNTITEEAGVIGAEEGTKPRRILMSMEQFQNYVEEKN